MRKTLHAIELNVAIAFGQAMQMVFQDPTKIGEELYDCLGENLNRYYSLIITKNNEIEISTSISDDDDLRKYVICRIPFVNGEVSNELAIKAAASVIFAHEDDYRLHND